MNDIIRSDFSSMHAAYTISSAEQLAALPFLTLIREIFRPSPGRGLDYGGVYERRTSGWQCIAGTYVDSADNGEPKLPARLLWHPDWTRTIRPELGKNIASSQVIDPAIEAAQRAVGASAHWLEQRLAAVGAREALKPIRELHKPVDYFNGDDGSYEFTCGHCDVLWPCATAKLIYSTEELA